jgi:hypothetical protein
MNEIEIFDTFSGLMINRNKTEPLISLLFLIRRAKISTDKTNSKADKGNI